VPSLLEFGVFGFGAMGREEQLGLSVSGVEGNDVPDLDGNDVSRDEVEVVDSVRDTVGIDVALVGAGAVVASRGLDLNAEEVRALAAIVVQGFPGQDQANVVRRGVSPGTEDGEAALGGAGHKKKLGPLAALFEVAKDIGTVIWHWTPEREIKNRTRGCPGDDGAGALASAVFLIIAMWCISIISICKGIYGQGLQEYISGVLLELREFGGAEGLDKNSGEGFGSIRKWETRILS
jgi:hypothetical protein